jgi:hypothetical protein
MKHKSMNIFIIFYLVKFGHEPDMKFFILKKVCLYIFPYLLELYIEKSGDF